MDSTNKDLSHSLNKANNNPLRLCQDRICLECGDDHSFRGYFDDAVTSIEMLPGIFPVSFKVHNRCSRRISICKSQEFVN